MIEPIILTVSDVRAVWLSAVAFDDEREAYGAVFDKLIKEIEHQAWSRGYQDGADFGS